MQIGHPAFADSDYSFFCVGLFAEWLLLRLARDIHEQLLTAVPRGALQKLSNLFCVAITRITSITIKTIQPYGYGKAPVK